MLCYQITAKSQWLGTTRLISCSCFMCGVGAFGRFCSLEYLKDQCRHPQTLPISIQRTRVLECLAAIHKCLNRQVTHSAAHNSLARASYMAQPMGHQILSKREKMSYTVCKKEMSVMEKENRAGKKD